MDNQRKLDILAFGAHADDVEIGMAGTIAKLVKQGKKVGICDLTKAELSSNGTISIRHEEATRAKGLLQVETRVQLDLGDRRLFMNEQHIEELVSVIRTYKPEVIFSPYFIDRHPDHGNCTNLVKEAIFSAGIKKYDANVNEPHKVRSHFMYLINSFEKPTFIVDISEEISTKIRALQAYESQFVKNAQNIKTPLNDDYIESVVARERLFGKQVGVTYGEGFISEQPVLLHHFMEEKL